MKKNVEKKIMGNLVVKANSLINASFKLDLIEQRLIILAITEARETGTGITSDSSLTVQPNEVLSAADAVMINVSGDCKAGIKLPE